jgi:transcriptional regulator with XRE-family HTH domain
MKFKKNPRLEERRRNIPNDTKIFVEYSFQIVDKIHEILASKDIEQKDLARLLNKSESEISKWMTGTHNFTLKTISKIEDVLEEKLLEISINKKIQPAFIVVLGNSVSLISKGDRMKISQSVSQQFNYPAFN